MPKKIVQLKEEVIKRELKELMRNSVEETLKGLLEQEAYLAGVSVRRVEDITEALWGTKGSPPTVITSWLIIPCFDLIEADYW